MKQRAKDLPKADEGGPAVSVGRDRQNPPIMVAVPTEDAMKKPPVSVLENGRLRGRPATGKRSNPDWKLYSHFLRKSTQRAAVAKLQAVEDGRDLSDVLQELLERWLNA
jgi:hypothetical protein